MMQAMRDMGVLQEGHFLLSSGRHSGQYMQCAAIFEYPARAEAVIRQLLPRVPAGIDTVVAPAMGGIHMGYELARLLGCRFIFTERVDGTMMLRRGFALQPGENVFIAEDVVTTGGSVFEVIDVLKQARASIQGISALVDRSGGTVDFGYPFVSLLQIEIESYPPEACPLCAKDIAVVKPGSRSVKSGS